LNKASVLSSRSFPRDRRRALDGYLVALLAVGLVTALKIALTPWLGRDIPALAYSTAIMLAAYWGGTGAGLFATAAACAASIYYFAYPYESFSVERPEVALQCLVASIEGIIIAAVAGYVRVAYGRTRRRLAAVARDHQLAEQRGDVALARAQRIVVDNDRKARAILGALPDLVLRVRTDGVLLDGRAPVGGSAALGTVEGTLLTSLFPTASDELLARIGDAVLAAHPVTYEFSVVGPGGPLDLEAKIARSGSDEAVVVVRELGASRRQGLARLLDELPAPVVTFDTRGTLTYANRAAVARFPDLPARGALHPAFSGLDPARTHGPCVDIVDLGGGVRFARSAQLTSDARELRVQLTELHT
jgi:PAS domain-containing protein